MRGKVLLLSLLSVGLQIQAKLLFTGTNLNHSVVPQPANENVCEHYEACTTAVECSFGFKEKANMRPCSTPTNLDGVCCPTSEVNDTLAVSRHHKPSPGHPGEYLYLNAIHEGQQEYNDKLQQEETHRAAMTAKEQSESLFHRMLRPAPVVETINPHEQDDIYGHVFASRKYAELTNMTLLERQEGRFARVPRAVQKHCQPPVSCDPNARYRTITGACNNPNRTSWGRAGYPFARLLPPAYEDGVWAPRTHSVSGKPLASPRAISVALFPDIFRPDPHLNVLFMQLGQFISHDFTLSRGITLKNGKPVECCSPDGHQELTGDKRHFSCFPIPVGADDPFYSQFGVRCLNFVRSQLAQGPKCKLGFARQANFVTHFLDASAVYGSTDDVARRLRLLQQGKLRESSPSGIRMLPFTKDPQSCVPWARVCYDAGDIRTNQLLSLTMVHALFVREHNRIASELSRLNHNWDDETLYQESRRIVIGELQNMIFNEYLPILLGQPKVLNHGLVDPLRGYTNFYDSNVRPMTLIEVSGAAQRYGHSTVEGFFRLFHKQAPPEDIFIKDIFNDPTKTLEPNSFDDMMFSFNQQPMESVDRAITSGLTRFLFKERKSFGTDLAATNMQRGRDYAMRSYNDYRELAGLPRITDFGQIGKTGARLAKVYESPDDIDLWAGGLLERPEGGAVVGATFGHLLAEGYSRYKFGDRYYFTNGPEVNPGAFSLRQLREIRRSSLASIICANVDSGVDFYQAPEAFLQPGPDNVPVPCADYRILRLKAWRE